MKKLIMLVIFALLLSVPSLAACVFSLSDGECNAGDTVKLSLTLKCAEEGNSFAVSDFKFDADALEFKGFEGNERITELAILPPVFDNDKMVIVIGLGEVQKFEGELCTVEFAVKSDAINGEYTITADTVAKNFSTVLESSFEAATVKVTGGTEQPEVPEESKEPETPTAPEEPKEPEEPETPEEPDEPETPVTPVTPVKPVTPVAPSQPKEWKNPFADVSEKDWFYSAVRFTNEKGIINGVSETEFAPKLNVTRAMFVTLLYRLEGQPSTVACTFTDVKAGSWYESAVAWANEKKIVQGVSATEFAPDSNITREQMATMLCRWARYKGKNTASDIELTYTDSKSISDWARDSVAWATANGVMSGSGDKFMPLNYASRAEAAAVIMRIGK